MESEKKGTEITDIISWTLIVTMILLFSYYKFYMERPQIHCTTTEQEKFINEACKQYPNLVISCQTHNQMTIPINLNTST